MAGLGLGPGPYNVQLQVVPEAGGAVHSNQHSAPLVGAEAHSQAVHPRAGPVIGGPCVGDERSPLPKDVCGPSCREKETEKKCQWVLVAGWGQSLRTPGLGHKASAMEPTEGTTPVIPDAQVRACAHACTQTGVAASPRILALITAVQVTQRVWPGRSCCKKPQAARTACVDRTWGLLLTSSTSPKCFFGTRAKQQGGKREPQVMAGR